MILSSCRGSANTPVENEFMSSLNQKHFQTLRHHCKQVVEERSADCGSEQLEDVPQDLDPDTEFLILSDNNLTILRNTSFQNYLQLVSLLIDHNSITVIERGTFYLLRNLMVLVLSFNSELELHGDIFQWSCSLIHLLCTDSGLSGFVTEFKKSNLQNETSDFKSDSPTSASVHSCEYYSMNIIELSGNNIRVLSPETFSIDWEFYTLFLQRNPIQRVDPDTVASIYVSSVFFGYYPLSTEVIRNITLGVSNTYMITKLSIKYAGMTSIPPDLFDPLSNRTLQSLDLQGNKIILYPLVFAALNDVSDLNLQECNLNAIDPRYFEGMVQLRTLTATTNIISAINPDENPWNVDLQELELGLYQCKEIKALAFKGLQNLTRLILRHVYANEIEPNFVINIRTLLEFSLVSSSGSSGMKPTLLTLNTPHLKVFNYKMSDYHVFSDSNAMELSKVRKSIQTVCLQAELVLDELTFMNHSVFWDMPKLTLLDLSQNALSTLPPALFKNLFSLLNLDLGKNEIRSIAPGAFIGLTSLESLDISENELFCLPGNSLTNVNSLIELKLDSNALSYLDEDVFVSATMLTTLTLSNNHLVGFNRSTFDPLRSSLQSIDISGNSLACNCKIEWLVEFFNGSSPTFLHKEDTFCSLSSASLEPLRGKPFATFEYGEYCGLDTRLILGISAGLFSLFALFILFIISYHYRWFLGYKMFLLKLAILGYNEIQDGRDQGEFEYDINVMFVDSDEEWAANNFRPELERRLPTFERIAFGDNNLRLGMHYFDAVYNNVEKSFKTILLLSRAAVQDHIFMTKFRIAMNHVTDTKTENLILVFLEDVPDQELPYLVRLHLSGQGAYLMWEEDEEGQEYFWDKLKRLLNINLRVNHMIPPE